MKAALILQWNGGTKFLCGQIKRLRSIFLNNLDPTDSQVHLNHKAKKFEIVEGIGLRIWRKKNESRLIS